MARTSAPHSVSLFLIRSRDWPRFLARQAPYAKRMAEAQRFRGEVGRHCLIWDDSGALAAVWAGCEDKLHVWSIAALPHALPPGLYRLAGAVPKESANALFLGWLLGSYHFSRYKKDPKPFAELVPPAGCDGGWARAQAEALNGARDLINTPANDMGPAELAGAARALAKRYRARFDEIVGEELLREDYPAIYAVGKASSRSPRLIDLRWGRNGDPKVTLVGKGVCFDSGGLDIKSSAGMKLMKKDMAGAAIVLAIARLIMEAGLPVRLRVLVPAVENSISGNAYRPSDVIATRKGLTVEVGNTDAEGRLILCDALAEADSETPELLIDCATLTGAARTALGTDLPALFTPDDALAVDLLRIGAAEHDPLWRLPLWSDYRDLLKTPVADLNSAPDGPFAGAITAALYLQEFVTQTRCWAHIDMGAWNVTERPGRPKGAEPMAARAIFALVRERFARRGSRAKH